MLSESEIQAIRERAEKATKGPWEWRKTYGVADISVRRPKGTRELLAQCVEHDNDADFIAHAREDVPRLVQAYETTEAKLASALAEVERLKGREAIYQSCFEGIQKIADECELNRLNRILDSWRALGKTT